MLATALANIPTPAPHGIDFAQRRGQRTPRLQPLTFAQSLSGGTCRILGAKEHLFCEGDPASHVYLVEAGHLCIYRMMPDGRRQVIDFAYPGDVVGLGALGEHAANAHATTKSRVRCLPIATLHDVAAKDSRLGRSLYEALALELQASREHLFTISQCTAAERLATFLMVLSRRNARRHEDPNEIVLPMTRTDIADFLGLTIETVSRTLTKFRADGLIDIAHCVLVTILDPESLAQVAGGDGHGRK
ncbi:MAG: Crp/Fnr family transcriptional regulator [Hyphomicrobiaceae bacterium]